MNSLVPTVSAPEVPLASPAQPTSGMLTPSPSSSPNSVQPSPVEPLTSDELAQAMALNSPTLVRDLYEAAQRQITFETGRQGRLDAKATGLLQATGLSLTVLATFGAQVAGRIPAGSWMRWFVVLGLVPTLLAGLVAAIYATRALSVRRSEYRTVNERALFNQEQLDQADQKENGEEAAAEFRRFLTPHLWEIYRTQAQVHQSKAALIWVGQRCFMAFLMGVSLLCVSGLLYWAASP